MVTVADVCEVSQLCTGGVDITTTDGVQRRFADGDVVLVEDTTGEACGKTLLQMCCCASFGINNL